MRILFIALALTLTFGMNTFLQGQVRPGKIEIPVNSSVNSKVQLYPFYRGNDGGAYYFTQKGDKIYWAAEHPGQGYCHVGEGTINHDKKTVEGRFWSVPKYKAETSGTVTFKLVEGAKLEVAKQTGGFPAAPLEPLKLDQRVIDILPGQKDAAYTKHTDDNLTGTWKAVSRGTTDGQVCYIRQIGETVVIFCEADFIKGKQPSEASVFIGKRSGNKFSGEIALVSKGKKGNIFEKASFVVKGDNTLQQETGYKIGGGGVYYRFFPEQYQEGINSYIKSIATPNYVVNNGSNSKKSTDGSFQDKGGKTCQNTKVDIKHNFEKIGLLQEGNQIVPGLLVYVDPKTKLGNMGDIVFNKVSRASLKLVFPNVTHISSCAQNASDRTVSNPTQQNIENKIDQLMRCVLTKGYKNPNNWEFYDEYSHTSKQTALEIGASFNIGYFGAEASYFQASSSSRKYYHTVFNQVFYKVGVEAPANPANWFADHISPEDFKKAYSGSKPLGYISEVVYGRSLVMTIETASKYNEQQIKAAASFLNLGKVSTAYSEIFKSDETKVTIRALGGQAKIITGKNPEEYRANFRRVLAQNAEYSKDNPGLPIGYTIRYLKNNQAVKFGSEVSFTKETCFTNSVIEFEHKGGYIAAFEVTYKLKGSNGEVRYDSGRRGSGFRETRQIPGNANYIRVKISYFPGANRRELVEKIYEGSELPIRKKYKAHGLLPNEKYSITDIE